MGFLQSASRLTKPFRTIQDISSPVTPPTFEPGLTADDADAGPYSQPPPLPAPDSEPPALSAPGQASTQDDPRAMQRRAVQLAAQGSPMHPQHSRLRTVGEAVASRFLGPQLATQLTDPDYAHASMKYQHDLGSALEASKQQRQLVTDETAQLYKQGQMENLKSLQETRAEKAATQRSAVKDREEVEKRKAFEDELKMREAGASPYQDPNAPPALSTPEDVVETPSGKRFRMPEKSRAGMTYLDPEEATQYGLTGRKVNGKVEVPAAAYKQAIAGPKPQSPDQQVFDAAVRSVAVDRGIKLNDSSPLMQQLPIDAQKQAALLHKQLNALPPDQFTQALKQLMIEEKRQKLEDARTPIGVDSLTQTTGSGRKYVDATGYTGPTLQKLHKEALASGVPVLPKDQAQALQEIDTARANLKMMYDQLERKLPKDASGRIIAGPKNKVSQFLQSDAVLAATGTYRTAAIQLMRAAAGSKGLRINQAEIKASQENDIPLPTDTVETAFRKKANMERMLENQERAILVRDRSAAAAPAATASAAAPPANGKMSVISPEGVPGTIDASKWAEAQKRGFKRQ